MNRIDFKNWCIDQHEDFAQRYGSYGHRYDFHLSCVMIQVKVWRHLLKEPFTEKDYENCILAAWGHDILEDTNNSYRDLVKKLDELQLSQDIAEIIYCVTDHKGRNRAERKNDLYYKELKENKLAVYVKLCDLIANTLYSRLRGSSMYNMYKKEQPKFIGKLYCEEFDEMFKYLQTI